MKKLVWLLVLINLGLLAYFNKDVILPSAPKVAMAEILPEKISILTQQQIDALPMKNGAEATPASAADTSTPAVEASVTANAEPPPALAQANASCYEWGVFSETNLAGAQTAVSNLSLQAMVKDQSPLEAKRFWVYKPPLKSLEVAQAKVLELKALGIQELYIAQDAKWKNAISFGIFEDERLANNLLNELKNKGVRGVVKGLRNQGKGHASLQFNKLKEDDVTALKKLKSEFPEANLKEMACH
jgi:cell division septation protein DedD